MKQHVVGNSKVPARLARLLSLNDFEHAARAHLPSPIFAYISGGCENDRSFQANYSAFEDYDWLPRTLVDTSARTLETSFLGKTWSSPVGIAPMGISALSAYRGDLIQTQAAAAANIPAIMSGSSLIPMEEISQANPDAWFQAYLKDSDATMMALVERAAKAGFGTLVITTDVPVMGNREGNIRARFNTPLRPSLRLAWDGITHPRWLFGTALRTLRHHGIPHFENGGTTRGVPVVSPDVVNAFGQRDHLEWRQVELIRRYWPGHLIIKGILHPDDALRARDHGADAIVVSNHGGRQLDGAIAPLRVLPEIVSAVGADYPVMIDSGFRRGNDVLIAIALGAKAVFVGRPFNYAGAIGGSAGIHRALEILTSEMLRNMALLGVSKLSMLNAGYLRRRST